MKYAGRKTISSDECFRKSDVLQRKPASAKRSSATRMESMTREARYALGTLL